MEQRPWNLHLELTNLCNAKCIFCAYQHQSRARMFMQDEVFHKALDDYCAIGGGDLKFQGVVGDPFLDPKFLNRVRLARERPEIAVIATITNGIAIKEKEIPDLVRSGLTSIRISTGPWRRDLYETIYRAGSSYDRMRRNVVILLHENATAGSPVEVKLSFRSNLSMKDTLSLADYRDIAHLCQTVDFNTDFDTWSGEIKQEDLLPGMQLRPKSVLEREPCFWFYDGPIVFPNGDVGICGSRDLNANSELIVGNIKNMSLLQIWRSDEVSVLRQRFRLSKFPAICQKCSGYANLDLYRTLPGSARAKVTLGRILKSESLKRLRNYPADSLCKRETAVN